MVGTGVVVVVAFSVEAAEVMNVVPAVMTYMLVIEEVEQTVVVVV